MKKQDVIETNGKAFTVIAVSDSDVDEGHAEGITHFSIDSNHNLKREGVRTTYSGGIVVALGEADMKDDEMEALRRSEDDNPLAENLKKLESDHNYKVFEFTDDQIEQCRQATNDVREQLKSNTNAELYDAYVSTIEKYQK